MTHGRHRHPGYEIPVVAGAVSLAIAALTYLRLPGCGEGSWVGEGLAAEVLLIAASFVAGVVSAAPLSSRGSSPTRYMALVVSVPAGSLAGRYAALVVTGCLGALQVGSLVPALLASLLAALVGTGIGFLIGFPSRRSRP